MTTGFDKVSALLFNFNVEGKIIEANLTAHQLLGYEFADLAGQSLETILPVASRIFYQTHWLPMLQLTQFANELFVNLLCKDGSQLPVLINSKRVVDSNGAMMITCVGIVIQNRMKYEGELIAAKQAYESALSSNAALTDASENLRTKKEELEKSYAQLERQLIELRQINKIVTHDIQEPVRKLLYYSDVLGEQINNVEDPLLKNVQRMRAVTQQLQRRVLNLQQYVWLTENDDLKSNVKLDKVVAEAKLDVEERFGPGSYILETTTLQEIRGNAEQLKLLFVNLIDNAVRFSAENRKPVITIQSTIIDRNIFKNLKDEYRYAPHVRILIRDNGRGIDSSLHEQMFTMMYAHDNPGGSGMGLTLCRKIVGYHHGTMSLRSNPGEGTTVEIVLPVE